jgi:hypothetical protein
MSSLNRKPGKTLNEVTVEVVKSFYNSDEVSRVMPGLLLDKVKQHSFVQLFGMYTLAITGKVFSKAFASLACLKVR